jgi:hypothetical protein
VLALAEMSEPTRAKALAWSRRMLADATKREKHPRTIDIAVVARLGGLDACAPTVTRAKAIADLLTSLPHAGNWSGLARSTLALLRDEGVAPSSLRTAIAAMLSGSFKSRSDREWLSTVEASLG